MENNLNVNENKNFAARQCKSAATVDEGLRQYMIKVYNYMGCGALPDRLCRPIWLPTPR